LIRDAIDLHCHSYPEFSLAFKTPATDLETLKLAEKAGMRAIVFKSHFWPTTGQVYHLRERISQIQALASITLNISSGGLSPWQLKRQLYREPK